MECGFASKTRICSRPFGPLFQQGSMFFDWTWHTSLPFLRRAGSVLDWIAYTVFSPLSEMMKRIKCCFDESSPGRDDVQNDPAIEDKKENLNVFGGQVACLAFVCYVSSNYDVTKTVIAIKKYRWHAGGVFILVAPFTTTCRMIPQPRKRTRI